jgi:hypothetical protein
MWPAEPKELVTFGLETHLRRTQFFRCAAESKNVKESMQSSHISFSSFFKCAETHWTRDTFETNTTFG